MHILCSMLTYIYYIISQQHQERQREEEEMRARYFRSESEEKSEVSSVIET